MVPPAFPLLLVVPAVAVDLIMRWYRKNAGLSSSASRPWWRSQFMRDTGFAVLIGVAFMALFMVGQWNFSKFLISHAADNWFFAGGHFFPYTSGGNVAWRYRFWDLDKDPLTPRTALFAVGFAMLFSRIAIGFGSWMSKVRR
jgi:hypothetical protein